MQGLAVMEAMTTGLTILAANLVALPELVQNGVNGYLFESMVEDLADKMPLMLALRDRWEDMGQSSLDLVRDHDMPAVLAQIEEQYGGIGVGAAPQPCREPLAPGSPRLARQQAGDGAAVLASEVSRGPAPGRESCGSLAWNSRKTGCRGSRPRCLKVKARVVGRAQSKDGSTGCRSIPRAKPRRRPSVLRAEFGPEDENQAADVGP